MHIHQQMVKVNFFGIKLQNQTTENDISCQLLQSAKNLRSCKWQAIETFSEA